LGQSVDKKQHRSVHGSTLEDNNRRHGKQCFTPGGGETSVCVHWHISQPRHYARSWSPTHLHRRDDLTPVWNHRLQLGVSSAKIIDSENAINS